MIAPPLAAVIAAWLAATQAPVPRDARPAAGGSATLAGIVVSDDFDAKPIRRARVTCAAPQLTDGVTAVTDGRGRFTCARLPAGRYSVNVTRDGWVAAAYGAKRPLRPGTPIPIAAGERADIVIHLMRGAVVTGILLDESGQPAAGARVVAMRSAMQNGDRRLVALGSAAAADDRGVYRIYGLPPGDYFVSAAPAASAAPQELQLTTDLDVHHAMTAATAVPPPPDRRVVFAPTYFPGTPLAAQASAITLRSGEEREGVDFALQLVATARVDGTIAMPDGSSVPPGTQLVLMPSAAAGVAGSGVEGLKATRVAGDGAFTFTGVGPGVYRLLARATTPAVLWAAADIAVDGERVNGVNLTLQPGLAISGDVRFVGAGSPPFGTDAIRIVAEPEQLPGEASIAPQASSAGPGGHFQILGVTPGRYRITATFPTAGRNGAWMLRSAELNGIDTLDTLLDVRPGQSVGGLVITLTDRSARLAGVLRNATGAALTDYTVLLFPADPALWRPRARRIRTVRIAADGAYSLGSLPAGDYLLTALDDVEPGEWFDPAFLGRLAAGAMHVTLAEGEHRTQDVRIGPAS